MMKYIKSIHPKSTQGDDPMPAAGAHYQFGQLVLAQLDLCHCSCLPQYKNMFDLGCQGPDLLFFYRPYHKNMVACLGGALHRDSGAALFAPLVERRKMWTAPLTAYLLGVCCHYALDSACHPLIDQLAPSSTQHRVLEAALDRLVFDQYGIYAPRQELLPKKVDLSALQTSYPQLNPSILKESACSIRWYNHLLEHPKLVISLEKLLGKQGAFSSMCVPESVEADDTARQVLPLFEGAIPHALRLIALLLDQDSTEALLYREMEKNFEGVTP